MRTKAKQKVNPNRFKQLLKFALGTKQKKAEKMKAVVKKKEEPKKVVTGADTLEAATKRYHAGVAEDAARRKANEEERKAKQAERIAGLRFKTGQPSQPSKMPPK